ncbi:hypothetical protein COW53_06115 [bacterium CG17_big_fil_post_rev_8_21_14_2_50_64_8]|nr:MAG: hypothetical protein COW53_06115 [bacterium CG17_big_fil_post_rev_8_21_14_2_50_64_8]
MSDIIHFSKKFELKQGSLVNHLGPFRFSGAGAWPRCFYTLSRLVAPKLIAILVLSTIGTRVGAADTPPCTPTLDLGSAIRTTTVEMHEAWRIESDDERILLGMVTDGFLAADGSIILLDSQLQQVIRISPSGEEITTLCRAGEGPGELSNVYDIEPLPNGALGLISVVPPSIAVVGADGVPAQTIRFALAPNTEGEAQYFSILRCRPYGEGFIGVGEQTLMTGSTLVKRRFLAGFDGHGREATLFDECDRTLGTTDEFRLSERDLSFPPGDAWDVDRTGRVFSAIDRDRYAIQIRNAGGSPIAVLERPFERHERSNAEREEAKANFAVTSTAGRPQVKIEVDAYAPVILNLRWVGDRLWVINSDWKSGIAHGGTSCFDVVDPDAGTWEVRCLSMPLDPRADMLIPLDARHMLRVRNLMGAFASTTSGAEVVVGEGTARPHDEGEEGLAVILYEAVE